jgi:hypothetical protein
MEKKKRKKERSQTSEDVPSENDVSITDIIFSSIAHTANIDGSGTSQQVNSVVSC